MIELGHYSLIFAWAMTLFGIVALWVSRSHAGPWRVSGQRAVVASFVLIAAASAALLLSLASRDFRLEYVAAYTSLDLPMVYVLTAFWGGQSGSLLFWTFLLALFALIVTIQNRRKHADYLPYVAAVILVVQHFFLSVMLYTANPFEVLETVPADGRGLNPLLQNFFMVIHPPLLYLGYVAFTVPFAFAIAALALGKTDAEWLRLSRRWTVLSWGFLTAGILLGAYWAYIELGWGGYWAWDPVENASLLPWLVGTAYLHSVMAQKKEGLFRRWNFALIILTFELCIFGTFLTRSGIVSSVHAFADSNMGPLFLIFLGTSSVLSCVLLLWRAPQTRPDKTVSSLASREGIFLMLNALFLALTLAVLWGTLYPTIMQAVTGGKVSITADFFNSVTWPLALCVLLLLAFGPWIGWQRVERALLLRNLVVPALLAIAIGVLLSLGGVRKPVPIAFFVVCSFVIISLVMHIIRNIRTAAGLAGRNTFLVFPQLLWSRKRHYGALVTHLGVAVAFVGILASSSFNSEFDLQLKKGQVAPFGDYRAELLELSQRRETNKDVVYARIRIDQADRVIGEVRPQKDFHFKFEQPQTEIAILSRLSEDIYVVLLGWEEDGSVVVRVNVNPLISLLWLGGLMILAGSIYVLLPASKTATSRVTEMESLVEPTTTEAARLWAGVPKSGSTAQEEVQ